jgi:hypothetical protein
MSPEDSAPESSRCALLRGGCFLFCAAAVARQLSRITALDRRHPTDLFPAEYCGRKCRAGSRARPCRAGAFLRHLVRAVPRGIAGAQSPSGTRQRRREGARDCVADADQRVQRFFETTPVDFPILLDRDRTVAKAWQVATLPTTFVLDAGLRPRFVVETDYAWNSLDLKELTGASATGAGGPPSIKDASNR